MKILRTVALVVLACLSSCKKSGNEETILQVEPADIIGDWEIVEWTYYYGEGWSGPPSDNSFSSHLSFFENGRFETRILYGFLVEGSWTLAVDGIHCFVVGEPLFVLNPIGKEGNEMTFRMNKKGDRLVCRKGSLSEFAPGYGYVQTEAFFQTQLHVDAFLQSVIGRQSAFNYALEELKGITILPDTWQEIAQIETMWDAAYEVMARANQAIDALEVAGLFPDIIVKLKYLRAWSTYVRVVCWGRYVLYWEHAGASNVIPVPVTAENALQCALADLVSNTSADANLLKGDIESLLTYGNGGTLMLKDEGQRLSSWGVKRQNFPYLPIPWSWLSTNPHTMQNDGWH